MLPRRILLLPLLAMLLALPAIARGQVKDVEPYYVTAKRDGVLMRCSPGMSWYPVAELEPRQVLRVDGAAQDGPETWLRVHYPPGMSAIVKIADASLDQAKKTVTLTSPAAPRAINKNAPDMDQSFISLFPEKLPPGTKLAYEGDVRNAVGSVVGYRVAAPDKARGYVLQDDIDRSTEAAYRRFMKLPPKEEPKPETPVADDDNAGADDQAAEQADADDDAETTSSDDEAATEDDAETVESADDAAEESADDDAAADDDATATDTETTEAETPEVPEIVVEKPAYMQRYEKLEDAYDSINEETLETAEFEPLLNEYETLSTEIPNDELNAPLRRAVEARVALLRLRSDFQKALHFIDDMEPAGGVPDPDPATRHYVVTGKLSRSAIYDGVRLPLMYRVMSIDGRRGDRAGRTLAYVKPDDKLDLPLKINQVVGVVNDKPIDRRRKVNILEPRRVDVIDRD